MKKISNIMFDNMGENHTFPNGMVVIIDYAETNDFGIGVKFVVKLEERNYLMKMII